MDLTGLMTGGSIGTNAGNHCATDEKPTPEDVVRRFVFSTTTTARPGLEVVVVIEQFRGPGSYTDVTTDQDSPTGTRAYVTKVIADNALVRVGVASAGLVVVDRLGDGRASGSLHLSIAPLSSGPLAPLDGRWSCTLNLLATPGVSANALPTP